MKSEAEPESTDSEELPAVGEARLAAKEADPALAVREAASESGQQPPAGLLLSGLARASSTRTSPTSRTRSSSPTSKS